MSMSIQGRAIAGAARPVPPNPAPLFHPSALVHGWDGIRAPLSDPELTMALGALWRYHATSGKLTDDTDPHTLAIEDLHALAATPGYEAYFHKLELAHPFYGIGWRWIMSGIASTTLNNKDRTDLVRLTLAPHFSVPPFFSKGMHEALYPISYLGSRLPRSQIVYPTPSAEFTALHAHLSELRGRFPKLFPTRAP